MLFRVVAVSTNTNSFGLYQHVLMGRGGETWTVLANELNRKKADDLVDIATGTSTGLRYDGKTFAEYGFECPEEFPERAPPDIVAEVWGPPIRPAGMPRLDKKR